MQFYRRQLPATCISFTSKVGKAIFAEAMAGGTMNSFFTLVAQFRTQDEPAYCGLTSLVMALNTLQVDPGRIWKSPWRWYHEDMLDCCTPLDVAREKGINMEQFVCLARCNGLNARARLGSEVASLDELRQDVVAACSQENLVFVATYSRAVLQQTGDGHFSPVAGYHRAKDMVLILDTARFKYPPHWIPLTTLLDAMNTIDEDTGKKRGYILLSNADSHPSSLLFRPSCDFAVDQVQGTILTKLETFFGKWSSFMTSPVDVAMTSQPQQIINEAVHQLVDVMGAGHLPVRVFCTSLHCSEVGGSNPHAALKCTSKDEDKNAVYCDFQALLAEFSSLKTFTHVQNSLRHSLSAEEKGTVVAGLLQCDSKYNDVGSDENCCGPPVPCKPSKHSKPEVLAASAASESIKCLGDLVVLPEHLMTLFLLVWPHNGIWDDASKSKNSTASTFGDHLTKLFVDDLESSTGQYVKNEIKSIRYKLEETLKYHGFKDMPCCHKEKCKVNLLN